jgi:hypothetical protein
MNPLEISSNLAKATFLWLNYKSLTGFDRLLGESMLKVPISEYLIQTSCLLNTEFRYQDLPGADGLDGFWCDFAGESKSGSGICFLLETKFLKRPINQVADQLAADIIRLSLPPGRNLIRLLLLAGKRENFESESLKYPWNSVFALPARATCKANFQETIASSRFLKSYPIYAKPIKMTEGKAIIPESTCVECLAIEEEKSLKNSYRVTIWSISEGRLMSCS